MFSGSSANISGGGDYSKYIQTPEESITYQIAHNIHDNTIKDDRLAITKRGIDSLTRLIKNIKP